MERFAINHEGRFGNYNTILILLLHIQASSNYTSKERVGGERYCLKYPFKCFSHFDNATARRHELINWFDICF